MIVKVHYNIRVMKKIKVLFKLFLTMFKIGLFTFGGGYAMIAVLQKELVERKEWIEQEEFIDLIAIAESTPGPIAINSATYIGYKVAGVFGSVFATLGMVLPSFTIIYLISLIFDKFLSFVYVQYAFRGIQACIAFLILSAGIKMLKSLKRTAFNLTAFTLTVICLVGLTIFAVDFSTIFYILIGGVAGLIAYFIQTIKNKKAHSEDKDDSCGGEK